MKQEQILEENQNNYQEAQDDELDMRNFLKDIKSQHQRINQATSYVQEQDKKIVGVNEKLDDYDKEVSHGEKLLDIVQKGPFESIIDGIKGLFKSKKTDKINDEDKKILEKAKNKKLNIDNNLDEDDDINIKKNFNMNNYEFKEDGDWEIIKDKNKNLVYEGEYDEDAVIEEATKEVKAMINSAKYFNKNINDSKKVINITNNHFDKSLNHVNQANKKMKKGS